MNIILLGPPGAGKGTLSANIIDKYQAIQLSTGDLFRYNLSHETDLGKLAKSYMDKGDLVPDDVTISLVWDFYDKLEDKDKIILFDGFPRTIAQAEALDKGMDERNSQIDQVILIDVAEDILIDRITGRRVCQDCGSVFHITNHPPKVEGVCDKCGGSLVQRKDDTAETVKNRIEVYLRETAPLVDYYRQKGILSSIDGTNSPSEVFEEFKHKLGEPS